MKVFGKNNSEDINQNEAREKSCSYALIVLPSTGRPTVNKVSGVTYTHFMTLLMIISEGLFFFHPKLEIS